MVSGSSFGPIDLKIRTNDADGSNHSKTISSDPLVKGVATPCKRVATPCRGTFTATPLQGGRDSFNKGRSDSGPFRVVCANQT
jgi:hypothetical protein